MVRKLVKHLALCFGSDHHLPVHELELRIGLCADSTDPLSTDPSDPLSWEVKEGKTQRVGNPSGTMFSLLCMFRENFLCHLLYLPEPDVLTPDTRWRQLQG